MGKISPRTLSGFMELLPQRQVLFDKMIDDPARQLCVVRIHASRYTPNRIG